MLPPIPVFVFSWDSRSYWQERSGIHLVHVPYANTDFDGKDSASLLLQKVTNVLKVLVGEVSSREIVRSYVSYT